MTPPQGRRTLVVGAAHGLGAAIAAEACRRGGRLVCADLDLASARQVAAAAPGPGQATALRLDLRDADGVAASVDRAADLLGGLDAVVQAAGTTVTAPVHDTTPERWRQVLSVNLDGSFLVARSALAHLGTGGVVLFVGSQLAAAAVPDRSAYIASKGGIEALTRALAVEVAPRGVRVLCLAPGPIDTGMLRRRLGTDAEAREAIAAEVPLGRLASAEEIAATAVTLLGDDASYLTGTTVVADGGYRAR